MAESNTVELDSQEDLVDSELGEDGLPIVPDLADTAEVARMIYVLMMTSRADDDITASVLGVIARVHGVPAGSMPPPLDE